MGTSAYKLRTLAAATGQGLEISEATAFRLWVARPPAETADLNPALLYYGIAMIDGVGDEQDDPDRVYVPSWETVGESVQVGEIYKQRTPASRELTVKGQRGPLSAFSHLKNDSTHLNVHLMMVPKGARPDNPDAWLTKHVSYHSSLTNQGIDGDLNVASKDDNEERVETYGLFPREYFFVNPMRFAKISDASAVITRVALDADAYYNDGNVYLMVLHDKLSTTNPSAISVTRNNTALAQTDISALSTNGVAAALRVVGDYVLLARSTSSSESYLWASAIDLVKGTVSFTAVTSGFVSTKGPTDIYVKSSAEIFMPGLGGYVYRVPLVGSAATVIDAGETTANNLNAMHGFGKQVIAVGASNTLILSNDHGNAGTFVSYTGPESGAALNCVWMVAPNEFYVGTATGKVHYGYYNPTLDTITYRTNIPVRGATPTAITDIRFSSNRLVGYLAYTAASSAGIARTVSDGAGFSAVNPEVSGVAAALPSSATAQAVVPIAGDYNACYIVASASADGLIALGL